MLIQYSKKKTKPMFEYLLFSVPVMRAVWKCELE